MVISLLKLLHPWGRVIRTKEELSILVLLNTLWFKYIIYLILLLKQWSILSILPINDHFQDSLAVVVRVIVGLCPTLPLERSWLCNNSFLNLLSLLWKSGRLSAGTRIREPLVKSKTRSLQEILLVQNLLLTVGLCLFWVMHWLETATHWRSQYLTNRCIIYLVTLISSPRSNLLDKIHLFLRYFLHLLATFLSLRCITNLLFI